MSRWRTSPVAACAMSGDGMSKRKRLLVTVAAAAVFVVAGAQDHDYIKQSRIASNETSTRP